MSFQEEGKEIQITTLRATLKNSKVQQFPLTSVRAEMMVLWSNINTEDQKMSCRNTYHSRKRLEKKMRLTRKQEDTPKI